MYASTLFHRPLLLCDNKYVDARPECALRTQSGVHQGSAAVVRASKVDRSFVERYIYLDILVRLSFVRRCIHRDILAADVSMLLESPFLDVRSVNCVGLYIYIYIYIVKLSL